MTEIPSPGNLPELLSEAARLGARYLAELGDRRIVPGQDAIGGLAALGGALPEGQSEPLDVISLLDRVGSPATVATAGPRYFGFVTGGSLPSALAANTLAAAWDQNACLNVMSPVASTVEEIAGRWVLDLLGLPRDAAVGFTTGATMANLTGLAAARRKLLAAEGWDVEERGLFGAPEIDVVVGDEVHVSLLKALALLGFGRGRVTRVPVDGQGRLRADRLPRLSERSILCLQAGNVNTGATDPLGEAIGKARAAGAWVHIDGAFGLWALASPALKHLAAGAEDADSWATDGHKWLNVPYDSGLAIVRDGAALNAAMGAPASYLVTDGARDGYMFAPEMSRRARGVEIWAAIRSLGRTGVADLIDRCVALAQRFAGALAAAGHEILNEVSLNQVLVSFGDAERTRRVIAAIQRDGTCWCGGTVWQGRTAMRISVSSWATTEADVDLSLEAITRLARETN
jgi:glutamate/tyrosine decarboxylase-like PLP-dependent enzyme